MPKNIVVSASETCPADDVQRPPCGLEAPAAPGHAAKTGLRMPTSGRRTDTNRVRFSLESPHVSCWWYLGEDINKYE